MSSFKEVDFPRGKGPNEGLVTKRIPREKRSNDELFKIPKHDKKLNKSKLNKLQNKPDKLDKLDKREKIKRIRRIKDKHKWMKSGIQDEGKNKITEKLKKFKPKQLIESLIENDKEKEQKNEKGIQNKNQHKEKLMKKNGKIKSKTYSQPKIECKVGDVVVGKVINVQPKGVVIEIGKGVVGFVPAFHFPKKCQKNPETYFKQIKQIKCRIYKMQNVGESRKPKISLTCNRKLMNGNLNILSSYEQAKPKTKSHGVVVLVQKRGILVEFFNGVKGYVPYKNLSKANISDPEEAFKVGQVIKCFVENVMHDEKKMTCSLAGSLKIKTILKTNKSKNIIKNKGFSQLKLGKNTKNQNNKTQENVDTKKSDEQPNCENDENKTETTKKRRKRRRKSSINALLSNDIDVIEENNAITEPNFKKIKRPNSNVLQVDEFKWEIDDATPNLTKLANQPHISSSDSESEDDEGDNSKRKKTRKERNEESRLKEEQLRKKEETLMDLNRTPETIDDFERSVLLSPNSSIVWLRYIAFHLEQAEVDKARAVGERALKTINFREEQEKLNIWFALLNLENLYGTQASLDELLQRAIQYNEPIKIFNHLAQVYISTEKHEQAELLHQIMLKKFNYDKNVYINFGLFYYKTNRTESARKLLQKSLNSLDKKEHIEVISKFGQMEFKFGNVERGKTIFENILSNYPKRTDLWSVYLDLMIKHGIGEDNSNIDSIRAIFERIITLKFTAKKMRFFFKRYIDFESQFGTNDRIQRIKQKELEYVEAKNVY